MNKKFSLLALLVVASDLFFDGELAALDGHENVGVLCCGRDEFSYDKLVLLSCAHAQRLETLQTVGLVDVELLQSEARVLHQIREQGRILHWLDDVRIVWEVLYGDTYTRSIKQTI